MFTDFVLWCLCIQAVVCLVSCCHPFQITSSFGGSGKYAHLVTLSCGINPHCDISVHEPPHLYPQHTFCPNVPSFVIVFATNKTNMIGSGGVLASYHVIMCLHSFPLLNLSTQCLCCAMPCDAFAVLLATKPLPCVSSLCPSNAYLSYSVAALICAAQRLCTIARPALLRFALPLLT